MATLATVLGVIALTVWAAVAADVFHGPMAVLAGAVLTALSGVAAGYVPLIRDGVLRRRGELARLETEEAADQEALRRAGELPGQSPAGLLDPRRGLVGFTGRETELAGLLAWCRDGARRGVRLVTGPGGVGKTRLSVELCARLNQEGWRCVRVGDGEDASALGLARRGWPGRVLLVVDYAETRAGLPELLRAVAADAGPVRVLLLARSAGEWRDRLAAAEPAVRELVAGAGGDEPLAAAVSGELTNADLVAAAVPAFAAGLGVPVPELVLVDVGAGEVRVLDLHAAALVAVLRSARSGRAVGPVRVRVDEVLGELLRHEERFWQGSAGRLGLLGGPAGMATRMLRQVVAAGALLGAASEAEAVALLGRVPGAVTSVLAACWLRDLYPPLDEAGWLGSLGPDRLAGFLVVRELTASAELAGRCLAGLDERQALRAITVLGRAAVDQEASGVLLERVLPLVECVVDGLPDDLTLLTVISDAIPYPSAALAEADLAVTRRILPLVPDEDRGLRARWLSWLGTTLAQVGRPTEALSAELQAVAAYRELAEAYPGRYRPDLAALLNNLGVTFWALGRPAEALPVTEEAVAIRRELAEAYPDRYRPGLADALSNLGVRFWALGRLAEALPVTEEAVAIRRELAEAYPDRYRPGLAAALDNLGVTFWALGRPAEALPVTEEAVAIRRELAEAHPDRYRPGLAAALDNLGVRFSALGCPDQALPVTEEAVAAYRELAEAYPDRYRPDLAAALANLGTTFWALGRPAEALPPTQKALAIRRELAEAYPGRYRPDLAASLNNLGVTFWALGRPAEALPVTEEAVAIRRELAEAYPGRYRPDLAASLSNLGVRFLTLGRLAEALPPTQEAVTALRELAEANPDRYQPDLAASLNNLGNIFWMLGRPAEALPVTEEAVAAYRELAALYPDRYQPNLAGSLQILVHVLDDLSRTAEAEAAERETGSDD